MFHFTQNSDFLSSLLENHSPTVMCGESSEPSLDLMLTPELNIMIMMAEEKVGKL